jgi:quercetin dioxygenase-like cupin family protein
MIAPHCGRQAVTHARRRRIFPPGSQPVGGPGHRHPGPEAWYVLGGAQCLETPNGVIRASAGETTLVPEGVPMAISDAGTEIHRTIVLILHVRNDPDAFAHANHPSSHEPNSYSRPMGLIHQ